ncbi:MutS-related protein [Cetobacterium sp.]|uniref:lysine 5,6-aminomutase reactivase ATPase KamC n=1 Tax=Cetobacterium sp. TaxID=2071632 RepID=UPI003F400394
MYGKIGFDYILENLDIASKLGKKMINKVEFSKDRDALEKEFDNIESVINLLEKNESFYPILKRKLSAVKDIENIVDRVQNGYVLDDIELFEIKSFSMASQEIYTLLHENYEHLSPLDLDKIIDILDPDRVRIKSFHIYNSYSIELAEIREVIKHNKDEELYFKELEIEDRVREVITKKILERVDSLKNCTVKLGYLDFILAKANQVQKLKLVRPSFSRATEIKKMFHPKVLEILEKKGKTYQEIDISISEGVTLITGANMSGKTLTLKSLGLIQMMSQSGFYVPAQSAKIKLVDSISLSIGDLQSVEEGLSSFAGEMLEIDSIVKKVKNGIRPLVLIDELARTTNPTEGRALSKSVIKILNKYNVEAVITTHYDEIEDDVLKLRVVGIKKDELKKPINHKNIEEYIDYSFIKIDKDDVPKEALVIAELLGIDDEIIKNAYSYLGRRENV